MRKYFNKLYLSIALVVLSLLTMVATTYAWVGLLTNTTFDKFDIELKDVRDNLEYGIQMSLDGIHFNTSINEIELKKTILNNMEIDTEGMNDNRVLDTFLRTPLDQCTTTSSGNVLDGFTDMNGHNTKKLVFFDLYLNIYKIGGGNSANTLSIYLKEKILDSSVAEQNESGNYSTKLFNKISYPNDNPVGDSILGRDLSLGGLSLSNSIPLGFDVHGRVSVNVASACRVAIEKYKAVDFKHPEQYVGHGDVHDELYIYQSGGQYPSYDPVSNTYDFGGILPDDYNFALKYYNIIYPEREMGPVPLDAINRGDITFVDNDIINHIVNKDDGVDTTKMVKMKIYFWFEGWDSDCFDIIDSKIVKVNLAFSTKENELD